MLIRASRSAKGKVLSTFNPAQKTRVATRVEALTARGWCASATCIAVRRLAEEPAALGRMASEMRAAQRMAARDGSDAKGEGYPSCRKL